MSQPQLLESGKTGASSDWTDGGSRSSVCALVRQHIPIGLVNLRSIPDKSFLRKYETRSRETCIVDRDGPVHGATLDLQSTLDWNPTTMQKM